MRPIILSIMFAALVWWVAGQLNAPAGVNDYRESVKDRQDVESRMAYHGLSYKGKAVGVVVLKLTDEGYLFKRNGQWCRL